MTNEASKRPSSKCLLGVLGVLAVGVFAGCTPATPLPPPTVAPKQLATVIVPPTPVSTADLRTAAPAAATPTPIPPTASPTPTRTPYVGIFMGDGSVPLVMPTVTVLPVAAAATLQPPTPIPGALVGGTLIPGLPSPTAPFALPAQTSGCPLEPDATFLTAYLNSPATRAALGCPVAPAESGAMAQQDMERGVMFWRQGTGIYALVASSTGNGTFWRADDLWTEGQPQDDPNLSPPAPTLVQPIRGFGLAWRSNPDWQTALGWGLSGEVGYTGMWQNFERGAMFTGQSGVIYALSPAGAGVTQGQYWGPLF